MPSILLPLGHPLGVGHGIHFLKATGYDQGGVCYHERFGWGPSVLCHSLPQRAPARLIPYRDPFDENTIGDHIVHTTRHEQSSECAVVLNVEHTAKLKPSTHTLPLSTTGKPTENSAKQEQTQAVHH